ncbi:YqaA family protein [Paraurantiacibacter namhicola]|uniref:SNARE associated Golgi protein n=1 Tax=Paraurantiacibacter namhicola TaxID=645517 RepID=A0A1C7D530_9SPHN|nr:DedA family protein [Paraurantiacibacter namhicola]ANU06586.1 SNARE associated Golgi protein [Paraurantiacibacter namhicola]
MVSRWLRALYDWVMEKAAHPHAQGWLALFCFVEASFFPIPPHPLLGLMCLAEPKKAIRFGVIATLASVAGGLLGYAIGWGLWDSVGRQLVGLLGMTESFPTAACYLREFDFEAILIAGATPVPFKLLTIASGFVGMNLVTFVLASIVGRGMIFFTVGVLFRVFGAPIKTFIEKYLGLVTIAFVALVVGGIIVLTQVGSGGEDPADKCAGATYESLGLGG